MGWYIPSYQELQHHPKTKRAARTLGISVPTMLGHLHCLWWWAIDYAADGDLSRFEPWEIAEAAMYEGDPEHFVNALVDCCLNGHKGFLADDGDGLVIHDWQDYGGRVVQARLKDKERKKQERSKGRPADVQRTSNAREEKRREEKKTLPNGRDSNASPPESIDKEGAAKWVALWVEAMVEAGRDPTPQEKAVFGRKVKDIPSLDTALMEDTIARMVELEKSPGLLVYVYGDCKKIAENEVLQVTTGGGRRVR